MKSTSSQKSPVVANDPKSIFLTLGLAFATALLLISLASPTQAAITWSGDLDPTDPTTWTSKTTGFIGKSSTGSINVNGAITLLSYDGYLGYNSGSTGTVTVTGSGSNWRGSWLYVGNSGHGTLNIEAGGQVNSQVSFLGYNSGSNGSVTVTGADSKWNSYDLVVGNSGTGTLNIEAGGLVSNLPGWHSLLGYNSGSSGTATVTGVGSTWTTGGGLLVGRSGTGTLNIEAGGLVSSSSSYFGYSSDSTGTATVTGVGSTWTNSGSLLVGGKGTGTLNIEAGGLVSDTDGELGTFSGFTGTVTVTGAGSSWTNSNYLRVGSSGTGILNIDTGGQVNSSIGYLGYYSGSSGVVTVTGTGSKWTNSDNLYVGWWGSGTLTVNNGGTVVVGKGIYASLNRLFGNGTILASGGVLDADLVFDAAHGSDATSMFDSGGTLTITPSANNVLGVGYKGNGTMQITEGVSVASSYGYLGYNSGSTGTATVTGAGSKWTNSNDLRVGVSGTGTLNIEAGGQVSSAGGCLGYDSGSSGTVTVIGTGSMWSNYGYAVLQVGNFGAGTLNIKAGGRAISSDSYLGNNFGSTGTVTVTGTGSMWDNYGTLYIGRSGTGTLNIGSGIASDGMVYAKSVTLADSSTATANCNLNGGTLQTTSITKGLGSATFNWSDGTIRNYNASSDLSVSGTNNLTLKLAATGTHAFNIDAGRTGTVAAVLCDATSGGTLAKQGDGLLVLRAINTYSGTTTIDGGQLKLVAGGDIAFSSEIKNSEAFIIDGGSHSVQKITGSGETKILSGSLTATSIVQDTLTIGSSSGANAVPEPSSLILLAISALGLAAVASRQRKK